MSKESQVEVTEKIHVINWWAEFQTLLPRQHWYLPWGTASSPNRAIRSCWTTSKLEIFEDTPVFSVLPSIKEFGVFPLSLSLSSWNRTSVFQAAELTFTCPQPSTYTGMSQISQSALLTVQWEGADARVCIYHSTQPSLLFTWEAQPFLVLASPALEGRAWYWPSCPSTSAYWKCTSVAAAARK